LVVVVSLHSTEADRSFVEKVPEVAVVHYSLGVEVVPNTVDVDSASMDTFYSLIVAAHY
jgi:hypothetical protein